MPHTTEELSASSDGPISIGQLSELENLCKEGKLEKIEELIKTSKSSMSEIVSYWNDRPKMRQGSLLHWACLAPNTNVA
ncbi:MAG: hypothetical protein MHPSP_004281, partial [Paramarteilia canceri]